RICSRSRSILCFALEQFRRCCCCHAGYRRECSLEVEHRASSCPCPCPCHHRPLTRKKSGLPRRGQVIPLRKATSAVNSCFPYLNSGLYTLSPNWKGEGGLQAFPYFCLGGSMSFARELPFGGVTLGKGDALQQCSNHFDGHRIFFED